MAVSPINDASASARRQLMLHAMAAEHADGAQLGKRLNKLCHVIGRLSQRHRGLRMPLPAREVASIAC